MEKVIEHQVEQAGERLDKYLSNEIKEYTRTAIQKHIEEGNITVNQKETTVKYKVKAGDFIVISIPEPIEVDIQAENIPLEIIHEDDDVIIVNKPQDMVVHPAPGNYTGTMVNALLYHCKEGLSGINGEIRPGIVHRIDKDTSGLLMVAKNDKAHLHLSDKLKEHDIIRKYHAIVYGRFKEEEGIIEKPIARSPKDRKKMAIVQEGRYAKTHYKVLETYKEFSYVELTLFTGRTHQIRVHMASIGHPLLGDPVYGPTKTRFGLNKQVLHAKVLGFEHPTSKMNCLYESELPKYFVSTIDKLRDIR